MSDTTRALTLASFAADSLSLGVHWIYDPKRIMADHGTVKTLLAPDPGSYHQGKQAGDFTHYGDQTLVLLESVAANKGFELQDFARRWKEMFQDYKGYRDMASKKTLQNFEAGRSPENAGSNSRDLAGASRIAPLVLAHWREPEVLEEAARQQTALTHADADVMDAAVFFARAAVKALEGEKPRKALESAAAMPYRRDSVPYWVEQGLASTDQDTVAAIQKLGPTCHVNEALPGAVHCIAKYESDLRSGIVQCVMAGGDSAARAMLVGMILAAWPGNNGIAVIPESWVTGLRRHQDIQNLIAVIP